MYTILQPEIPKGRDRLGDVGVDGKIV